MVEPLEVNMADLLEQQLASLAALHRVNLERLWQQLFETSNVLKIRKSLMIRFLAYRIQEQAYGGLSKRAQQRIKELSSALAVNPKAQLSSSPPIRSGTRLLRQWRDQMHVVNVHADNFEYRGNHYESLSEIARLITGTRRSGPLFFGLKQNQRTESVR
jgi:K+-sensing histidine kinase KdpD